MVAGDDGAAQIPVAQDDAGGRGGRRIIRRARSIVVGKAARIHDGRVAIRHGVHVGGEAGEHHFEFVPDGDEGEGGGLAAVGFVGQGDEEVADLGLQRALHDGRRGEVDVAKQLVHDFLGEWCEVRSGVAAEINDGFGRAHGW